jgi:hypothetical protein
VSHDLLKHPLLSQAIEKAYHEFFHPESVRVETKHNIMNISKDDMTFSFNKTHQHMQNYNPLFSFWAMPRIVTLNKSTD